MAKNKKEIPLSILQALNEASIKKSKFFKVGDSRKGVILRFNDADPNSDFFFQINGFRSEGGKNLLDIAYKPKNSNSVEIKNNSIELVALPKFIKDWEKLLEDFDRVEFLSDPILKQYEDEFYQMFEIVDEDANTKSFDIQRQLKLNELLDHTTKRIDEHKTEDNKEELEKIEKEIADLKELQSTLSKQKVVMKLSKIFALIRKAGIPLLKTVLDTTVKEVVRYFLKSGIDLIN